MIPFKLFKYIYFTYIFNWFLYFIIIPAILLFITFSLLLQITELGIIGYLALLPIMYITWLVLSIQFIYIILEFSSINILILYVFILSFIVIHFYKLILQETLFIKYFNIKIVTNMKCIDIKFLLYFILFKITHRLIYMFIIYCTSIVLNNYIALLIYLMYSINNYFLMNWFLSKYVNVLPNSNNDE